MKLKMKVGRKDCQGTPPERNIPRGSDIDSISFLKKAFNLKTSEAVAMLGEH